MTGRSPVIKQAEFLPDIIRYHMWTVVIFSVVSVVGIVLLPIVYPLSRYFLRRYYERLDVVLTRRDLKVRRGIINIEEKSIPLEQITDLALYQGPIMRMFNIKGMRVETAGQSADGVLVTVVGLADVEDFRDAVLNQRDRISDSDEDQAPASTAPAPATESTALLTEIRDSLKRIETQLQREA